MFTSYEFLPSASEGWGKVLFSVCLSVHTSTGGVPQPGLDRGGYPGQVWMVGGGRYPSQVWMVGGVPQSGLDGGGYPSQVWVGGYPGQVWMVGVPRPGLDGGGYPSQVWMVGVPRVPPGQIWIVGGYPGYPPSQVWMVGVPQVTPSLARSGWWGVPWPGLDGGGTLARSGWWGRYPSQVWMVGGTLSNPPPQPGLVGGVRVPRVPPSRQSSMASTCYPGGRYASCVHAGGLSCLKMILVDISVLDCKIPWL